MRNRESESRNHKHTCPSCLIKWAFTEKPREPVLCPVCNVPMIKERK